METLWGWIVFFLFFGAMLTALGILFGGLCRIVDWIIWKVAYPRRDAEQSYIMLREWQEQQLQDTPYFAPGRGDPTRPDDDDWAGPLNEIWRRES